MKRCPQCNRVETDDTLTFCRADGSALISASGLLSDNLNTAKFGSAPVPTEIETSLLSQTSTTPEISRNTGPTTALPATQFPGTTHDLTKPKRRRFVLATIGIAPAQPGINEEAGFGGFEVSTIATGTAAENGQRDRHAQR